MTNDLIKILEEVILKGEVINNNNTPILKVDLIYLEDFKNKYNVDFLSILDTFTAEQQNKLLSTYYK